VLEQLGEHSADVAVMAKMISDPRIHALKLRDDRLVVFVAQGHAWARRRRIRIAELAGRDMVVRERGSITREVFEARLAQAGITAGSMIEVQTREAVREAVAAGFGVGVVFDSEFGNDPRFHAIDVGDCDLSVGEYVACLEERRRLPVVRAFLNVVREMAANAKVSAA
jgi:DNA-binding transcriptional LysR family regulator